MVEAYKDFWKRYFDFKGKSNVQEFWTPVLTHIVLVIIAIAIVSGIEHLHMLYLKNIVFTFLAILGLSIIIPTLAVTVRRFYDAGRKRLSAVILLFLAIILNICADFTHIYLLSFFCTALAKLMKLIIVLTALRSSKDVSAEELKWI
ncbi:MULTISPECIES: DUF805 domain-containing protein [Staphylococcus]|uniref:DUF805 domain-containing protein n=1 Tax=Staphylococcus hsinchuensis TaxID=3051183 RepID=A0ABZ3EEJ8_9STAP|nr:DUF805 domain-containing protein [Staphylococcus sp. Marseille-Q6910]